MDNVKLFSAFGALAVAAGLVAGVVVLHFAPSQVRTVVQSGSSAGATFNTAKVAEIIFAPSTSAIASSTSVFNGDASDRIIQDAFYSCTGVGTVSQTYATWILTAATSASSVAVAGVNANTVLSTNVATSSGELYVASTSPGLTGSAFVRRWAAQSYLVFQTNATNTASCAIGVHYIAT